MNLQGQINNEKIAGIKSWLNAPENAAGRAPSQHGPGRMKEQGILPTTVHLWMDMQTKP